MAKKAGASGGSAAANQPTRCEEGGPEITAAVVAYRQGEPVDFRFIMCRTNARIRVFLTRNLSVRELLADESSKDEISLMIPPLGPGRHLLFWSFQGAGADWQSRAELSVNGVTRFRHRKTSEGNDPVNRGFLFLEVA